jgi:hypothetical protein
MRARHRNWMETAAPGREVVVEIKGPGQVVGEVVMEDQPPPCRYSSRARGDVVALKLTQENYLRALAAMYLEAESGARASASTGGGGCGLPAGGGGSSVAAGGGAGGCGLSPVVSAGALLRGGGASDGGGAAATVGSFEPSGVMGARLRAAADLAAARAAAAGGAGGSGDDTPDSTPLPPTPTPGKGAATTA